MNIARPLRVLMFVLVILLSCVRSQNVCSFLKSHILGFSLNFLNRLSYCYLCVCAYATEQYALYFVQTLLLRFIVVS